MTLTILRFVSGLDAVEVVISSDDEGRADSPTTDVGQATGNYMIFYTVLYCIFRILLVLYYSEPNISFYVTPKQHRQEHLLS